MKACNRGLCVPISSRMRTAQSNPPVPRSRAAPQTGGNACSTRPASRPRPRAIRLVSVDHDGKSSKLDRAATRHPLSSPIVRLPSDTFSAHPLRTSAESHPAHPPPGRPACMLFFSCYKVPQKQRSMLPLRRDTAAAVTPNVPACCGEAQKKRLQLKLETSGSPLAWERDNGVVEKAKNQDISARWQMHS